MTFYDEMQGLAGELLGEFKQGVINYCKITPGNGSVDNPGPSTKTLYGINGTAVGVQFKYVQQGLAVATDLQITAPVDARYTPDGKDFIEVDGLPHKIVEIMKRPAAGTPVAFVFIIRRGAM